MVVEAMFLDAENYGSPFARTRLDAHRCTIVRFLVRMIDAALGSTASIWAFLEKVLARVRCPASRPFTYLGGIGRS